MKQKDAIKYLERHYNPDEDICMVVWCVGDVEYQAENVGVTLNEAQCALVLEKLEDNHDCNIGINWDAIESEIWEVAGE